MSHAPSATGGDRAILDPQTRDPDARRLVTVMNTAFLALLAGSLLRYLFKHPESPRLPWVVGLSITLAALQLAGHWLGGRRADRLRLGGQRPGRLQLALLGSVVACWVVIVLLAPSFAWCAVPLIYTGLRSLPIRAAVALVAVLCALVMIAEWRLADSVDPNLFLLPPTVAVLATTVFIYMRRQADRLAATERREGTLAERQRLSMEIHDTLAQSLSSQQMLLQAAERTWDSDPAAARGHVRTAESIAERSLAEARRFVHDLAPADLAEGGGLDEALRTLAERESTGSLQVRFHRDGTPVPLPDRVQSALLRIAQGALANVREHAAATTAALTLSHLDDQVVLDIADDGRGFEPSGARTDAPVGDRGHGLPAMRARVRQLGGTLTVESTPSDGTVLSAAIPLERA
ncbi:sensor histidine kinase [Streptomyces sp. NBC_01481]|uniref:sensor histidine kinase n=1 Tax=Streptomyces sp. NBC_01481 TaxID=2975869 RepID=UPI00225622F9|nr:sensor histidine kinase [Streptomyces sp. NBC_01481]MCX4584458.1 sensor histidine kinase [Streptomyces sp. NBC_01481]